MAKDTYFQDLARKRKKLLTVLLITAGSLTLILWLLIGIFLRVMQPQAARECQVILRNIGSSLKIYSGKHGFYPSDISIIKDWGTEKTRCPNERKSEVSGYIYLEGLAKNPPPFTIMMFDKEENHTYGRNVCYADGRVAWCTEQIFRFDVSKMIISPYKELYPEKALKVLEEINNLPEKEGGKAIRSFSTGIMLLSLVTALSWIFTFIILLRYMQVAKYKEK